MEVAFARPGQVQERNVCMVALVVPMIVLMSSMLSCSNAGSSEVPEHAYITYGDSWRCERGFKKTEDECQSIKVPEHAFLSDYGNTWECERDFKREGNRCSPK